MEQMGCLFSGRKPKEGSMMDNSLSYMSAEGSSPKVGAAKQQLPARGGKGLSTPKQLFPARPGPQGVKLGTRESAKPSGAACDAGSGVHAPTCAQRPCGAVPEARRGAPRTVTPREKPTAGQKSLNVPQIVVTSASDEVLGGSPLQRTIHEEIVFGPYARHRNPSTIDAYALMTKE